MKNAIIQHRKILKKSKERKVFGLTYNHSIIYKIAENFMLILFALFFTLGIAAFLVELAYGSFRIEYFFYSATPITLLGLINRIKTFSDSYASYRLLEACLNGYTYEDYLSGLRHESKK